MGGVSVGGDSAQRCVAPPLTPALPESRSQEEPSTHPPGSSAELRKTSHVVLEVGILSGSEAEYLPRLEIGTRAIL